MTESQSGPNSAATPAERLAEVLAKIAEAAEAANRAPSDITLVAVSKTKPAEDVQSLLAAGHRAFGENRVQEAEAKFPALKQAYPDLELHLIGPLQTNKAKEAVALFDVIETLDRPKLAKALLKEMEKQDRRPPCFIQVNTGAEEQKAGVLPAEAPAFIEECRKLGLPVEGLMCIPPLDEDPAIHFAFLRELGRRVGLEKLSMGMSGDFEIAVRFGATHVRVGSALFGARDYSA
jgi:pyridoxal phosphate enzyme (YggS family)